jgi:hypothetical protein
MFQILPDYFCRDVKPMSRSTTMDWMTHLARTRPPISPAAKPVDFRKLAARLARADALALGVLKCLLDQPRQFAMKTVVPE